MCVRVCWESSWIIKTWFFFICFGKSNICFVNRTFSLFTVFHYFHFFFILLLCQSVNYWMYIEGYKLFALCLLISLMRQVCHLQICRILKIREDFIFFYLLGRNINIFSLYEITILFLCILHYLNSDISFDFLCFFVVVFFTSFFDIHFLATHYRHHKSRDKIKGRGIIITSLYIDQSLCHLQHDWLINMSF